MEGGKHVICDVLIKESVSTFFLFSKTTSLIFSGPPKVRKISEIPLNQKLKPEGFELITFEPEVVMS